MKKLKDFFAMFTFTFLPPTMGLALALWLVSEYTYINTGAKLPFRFWLDWFINIDLFFIALSIIISLIYVIRFSEYKKDSDGKQKRKRRRY